MTTGEEGFLPLGSAEPRPVRPGGYAYVDDANDVICLLEVKQVEKTKVTVDTTDCLFILQGNAQTRHEDILQAAERLIALVQKYCGGQARYL
jgi:DNA/RNA-binding domain of Phe-tRNA-synthetase-like protein